MPTKLARKSLPRGLSQDDFKYIGRPSTDQGDFGSDVGVADMSCVNQFGEANNAKYYHAGVVQANGRWFVYLEWGRIKDGEKSWNGFFNGQDYQFVDCANENEARTFFEKQSLSKNTKRLVETKGIWVSKTDKHGKSKDGYIVQSLATRVRGLPDAYSIKDTSGLSEAKKVTKKKTKKKTQKKFQPQVVSLANDLVGGTINYSRAASASTGVVPTMDSIKRVREEYLPLALDRISKIGDSVNKQIKDKKLIDISKFVSSLVPRPIGRQKMSATDRAKASILSSDNIFLVQQDLDAYESALKNEDFDVETESTNDPHALLGCSVTWLNPKGDGKWIVDTYKSMTNNRHGDMRGRLTIKNVFELSRPALDRSFVSAAQKVAMNRKGLRHSHKAGLQPRSRPDVSDISDIYKNANIFLGIHGTRGVNLQPIISSNLRLPNSLKGVHISGAAYGPGIYFATDWKKSYGYTGYGRYGGGGSIKRRGFFMMLCDVVMGKAHLANRGRYVEKPPHGTDSIAALGGVSGVQNDEHIIFNPNYQRIRYIIEGTL